MGVLRRCAVAAVATVEVVREHPFLENLAPVRLHDIRIGTPEARLTTGPAVRLAEVLESTRLELVRYAEEALHALAPRGRLEALLTAHRRPPLSSRSAGA